LLKDFGDNVEKLIEKIKLKRPIIQIALYWFKELGLSYPLKSWMDKMYIQLLMSFDLIDTAVDFYE